MNDDVANDRYSNRKTARSGREADIMFVLCKKQLLCRLLTDCFREGCWRERAID
ncbi:hypothetical protein HUO14_12040 [Parasphingorhabdus flavimaris]|uniref:Uncharacterized protein n=1 Tax=Parasphingorhabdus flavimaris TaxID=266812 RepID=A0ABX2N4I9_9SPHN|nr:hypothetical protein [Parasphingorhabdus flavimaris]NVD28621.1 hypothetical protein [Parasphingorhabdus flavimaris]|tara:strand:+ start:231 stop:392 length:162 start_codon:yes stop_codon:yes gene_type:complete